MLVGRYYSHNNSIVKELMLIILHFKNSERLSDNHRRVFHRFQCIAPEVCLLYLFNVFVLWPAARSDP